MWPLTLKRSLGMNTRQAHRWETDSQAVLNGSAHRMHRWRRFLHGCSQMETRLTKILEQIRSKGWTAKENYEWLAVRCAEYFWSKFMAWARNIFNVYFLQSQKSNVRILVSEKDEHNCAFLNRLIRYDTVFEFSVPWHDSILWSWIIIQVVRRYWNLCRFSISVMEN